MNVGAEGRRGRCAARDVRVGGPAPSIAARGLALAFGFRPGGVGALSTPLLRPPPPLRHHVRLS